MRCRMTGICGVGGLLPTASQFEVPGQIQQQHTEGRTEGAESQTDTADDDSSKCFEHCVISFQLSGWRGGVPRRLWFRSWEASSLRR